MFNSKTLLLAVACLILLGSCTKSGNTGATGAIGATGATGATGPSFIGAISGHVSLFDQYGSKVLTGLHSVQVSFNGTNAVSADSTGYYIFGNVRTGSYYFTATNNGFGPTRINNFQYLSDTLNRDIRLSAIPNFSPLTLTATNITAGDSLAITFAADTRARNCIVFLNNKTTVNGQPANYLLTYTKAIPANSTKPVTIIIPIQDLTDAGLHTGDIIYYAAFGYVVNDGSSYEDLTTGKTVFTPLSASSATATITAP